MHKLCAREGLSILKWSFRRKNTCVHACNWLITNMLIRFDFSAQRVESSFFSSFLGSGWERRRRRLTDRWYTVFISQIRLRHRHRIVLLLILPCHIFFRVSLRAAVSECVLLPTEQCQNREPGAQCALNLCASTMSVIQLASVFYAISGRRGSVAKIYTHTWWTKYTTIQIYRTIGTHSSAALSISFTLSLSLALCACVSLILNINVGAGTHPCMNIEQQCTRWLFRAYSTVHGGASPSQTEPGRDFHQYDAGLWHTNERTRARDMWRRLIRNGTR